MSTTDMDRIVFGSRQTPEERRKSEKWAASRELAYRSPRTKPRPHACFCTGPRPGETKCPCRLSAESEQGRIMTHGGIVIDGIEYELVPKRRKGRER